MVDSRGYILLLKSTDPNGHGDSWDFPGGQMEPNETPLQTLARETKEEIGVDIDVAKAELFFSMVTKGFGTMAQDDILKDFYVVPTGPVEITLSWEHGESRWVNPRVEMPPEVTGFAREVIDAYRKHEGIGTADKRIQGHEGYGLVQLIHGHGKGKTTAALGQSIRCAGSGRRVAIIYFDKGGTDHYFERKMLDAIDNINYWATGRDRIDPVTGRFDFSIIELDKTEAARGLDLAKDALTSGKYDLVVLDELNSTLDLGMLKLQDVLRTIDGKSENVELIITGRNPHEELLKRAHLVTEMRLQKHYFYSGVPAREGLDF